MTLKRRHFLGLALAIACLAAAGVAFSFRSNNDLGCLRGLEKPSEVSPSRTIAAVGVTAAGRVFVSTGDGRLYVKKGPKWRLVTSDLPGSSLTTVGESTLYTGDTAVFRSRDAGRTWKRLSCELLVSEIAVSPRAPAALYAGAQVPVDSDRGESGGLYRSTDGGRSWKRTSHFPRMDPDQPSVNVLSLDPWRPRNVYVGLESGGVQVSTDGGEHWRFDAIHQEPVGLLGPQLTHISFGPGGSRIVWASSRRQGVFRGVSGESRWEGRGFVGSWWVSQVVSDARDPDVAFVVAGRFGKGSPGDFVMRTVDGGLHWKRVRALPADTWNLVLQRRDNTLYVSNEREIYRSTDRGATWRRLPHLPL